MKHLTLVLLGAVAAFVVTGPVQAASSFRVIQWNISKACQIYDFGWGGRPIPPNYRVLTPGLPTFAAALRAKDNLARRGRCSI